jgi:hypothetical protein
LTLVGTKVHLKPQFKSIELLLLGKDDQGMEAFVDSFRKAGTTGLGLCYPNLENPVVDQMTPGWQPKA